MSAHQPYMREAKQSEQQWHSSACTKPGSLTGLIWLSAMVAWCLSLGYAVGSQQIYSMLFEVSANAIDQT